MFKSSVVSSILIVGFACCSFAASAGETTVADLLKNSRTALSSIDTARLKSSDRSTLTEVIGDLAIVQDRTQITYKIFEGSSTWHGGSMGSALDVLGVQKDAENRAMQDCQASGARDCVILGSNMTANEDCRSKDQCGGEASYWNQRYVSAKATARGIMPKN